MFHYYLTKGLLIRAAELGAKHDYNRQIDPGVLDDLDDVRHPVWLVTEHHHRHGQPSRTHVRLGVEIKFVNRDSWFPVIIDVPASFIGEMLVSNLDEVLATLQAN